MGRLWISGILLLASAGQAQVTGTFSLEKTVFAPGEPVFLSFVLHNEGKEAEEVASADPYSFCSGYKVEVTNDAAPRTACYRGWGGSCMSGSFSLAAGASHLERILLNYQNTSRGELNPPIRVAGDYTIEASREVASGPPGMLPSMSNSPRHEVVRATLHMRVDERMTTSPGIFQVYVQQLEAKDDGMRREAARVLATLAPASLEGLLMSFAASKDTAIAQFAPLALANLGTAKSLSALGRMLLVKEPGSYESMMAAEYLGATHDAAWMPLMLEVADQRGAGYLRYAAESGGDKAIPALLARMRSSDPQVRRSAIYALGSTGSRAAVPVLIGLLGVPIGAGESAREDAIQANAALLQLTHFYVEQDAAGSGIPQWQQRWQRWLIAAGPGAAVYKPGECVADTKLP